MRNLHGTKARLYGGSGIFRSDRTTDQALIKEKSFGFLYQYKNVILEAYMRQLKI